MDVKDDDDLEGARWAAKPADVGGLLSISRAQVYHLIKIGLLPSIRVGNSIRVPLRELRRYIEARTVGGAAVNQTAGAVQQADAPAPSSPTRRRRLARRG